MDDLSYSPATAALLPKIMRAARKPAVVAMTAEKEGAQDGPTGDAVSAAGDVLRAALARRLTANAQHVADGVKALEKEGVASFSAEVLAEVRADEDRALATAAALAAASADDVTFEIRIHGNAIAHKVAEQYGIPKIHNVQQAMASPYWPLIREGMEAEILGKLANKAFSVVPRKPGMRVMKSKWCIDFKFEKDGSIKSIKCRFVGCGYSQIEGADFDKTYAATLSGCCLRLWCYRDLLANLEGARPPRSHHVGAQPAQAWDIHELTSAYEVMPKEAAVGTGWASLRLHITRREVGRETSTASSCSGKGSGSRPSSRTPCRPRRPQARRARLTGGIP